MSTLFDWILFDADNTLLDFHAAETASLQAALLAEGIDWSDDLILLYREINHRVWSDYEAGRLPKHLLRTVRFKRLFNELGLRADPKACSRSYLLHLSRSEHVYVGVPELLRDLATRYQLGLITNGLREVQRPRLRATGLDAHFPVIVVSDEIGHAKPNAGFFDHAFAEMGRPAPQRVLVVGDNLNADIRGGQEYGCRTCWVNPQRQTRSTEVQPDWTVGSVTEIPETIGI
jgi:YjjG family noncanonical pyrimidine nucleotidase